MKDLPYKDLAYAKIDNHREMRVGYPEIIYCAGKTVEQVIIKKNNIYFYLYVLFCIKCSIIMV